MKRRAEPTIALINIVFLMLIFFLIAGSISPPMDGEIELVTLSELDGRAPSRTLAIHPDGRLTWGGESVTLTEFDAPEDTPLRLMPDRALPASTLLEIAGALQMQGAADVVVVTKRGLK